MNYTARIRSRSGAVEVVAVEAADRESAVRELRDRGVTLLSVEETRGGRAGGPRRPWPHWRGVLVAVAAAAVLALAAWFLLRPQAEKEPAAAPKEKRPAVQTEAPKPKPAPTPKVEAEKPVEKPVEKPKPEKAEKKVEKLPNGREIHTLEDGTRVLVLNPIDPEAEAERLRNLPPPMFKHEVESALDMYVVPGIDMPPPPRDYTNEEVLQALVEPVEIDPEKDDEDAQLHKRTVQQFKDELREFIKEGGTFNQYMRKLAERQSKEAMMIQQSRQMVMKAINEGKTAEAQELLDALNKHLSEQGIPAVKMPPPYRKVLEGAKQ